MANEKIFQSRIQLKHDIEENWSKATNFIPKVGEIIIYDIDENNSIARFKIGDGITNINSLPFVSHHEVISYLPQELTEEQKKQARENIGAGKPQIQADWDQNEETALDYIKNRTHYDDTIYTLRTQQDIYNILNDMGISYGSSTAKIIPGITFRVIIDGVVYDNVPIWSGCYYAGDYTWGIGDGYTTSPSGQIWHSTDYGFCFCGYGNSPILNRDIFPNGIESFEVYTVEKDFKYLDPKFIKDMYYETPEVATNLLNSDGTLKLYPWELDKEYTLRVDGVDYRVDGFINGGYMSAIGQDIWYLGAATGFDGTTVTVMSWDEYPFSIHGPQSYITNGSESLTIKYADGTTDHTVEIIEKEKNIKCLDPKYIKDMYFEDKTTIFDEQTISGFAIMDDPLYAVVMENILSPEEGKECTVEWDGVAYDVVWKAAPDAPLIYAGNENYVNMTSGGDIPFAIVIELIENLMFFVTESTEESHTVCVKEIGIHYIDPKYIKDMYYEETSASIKGLNYKITVFDGSSYEQTHNENIPLALGQKWNIIRTYDGGLLYGNVEVQQAEDGTLYLGTPGVSEYPFYITANESVINSRWYDAGLHKRGAINVVGASGFYDTPIIHPIDEKYLPILEEAYETVFETEEISRGTEIYVGTFDRLVGKYRVTFDGESNIVEFIDVPTEGVSFYHGENYRIRTFEGNIFFRCSDDEMHSLRIEKVKNVVRSEYLPDEAKAQADWNQNDETAPDYIKNRTHYEYEKLTLLKDPITVDCNSACTYGGIECYANTGAYAYWIGGWPSLVGQTIKIIFDGKPYDVPISKDRDMSSLTSYPFEIHETHDNFFVYALESGTHTLEFYSIDDYELKQLDEKFIPDTIARTDNFINGIKLTDTVTGLKYLVQIQDGTLVTTLIIEDLLIDFDYTTNEDGTYTLTNWKQTLNGEESTELIIPEYPKIIL